MLTKFTPAESLEDVYLTLVPEPLSDKQALEAFYRDEINATRGGNRIARLELGLNRSYNNKINFKACLMGHSGVGKTTELYRLQEHIKDKFEVIRFSATNTLDPGNFRPLDILLVMMSDVATEANKLQPISEALLREIYDWFSLKTNVQKESTSGKIGASAGFGVQEDSLWNMVSGLFARLKGEVKYASTRDKTVETYRLNLISELIELMNRLLSECRNILEKNKEKQWLFIGEDFDRAGIPNERLVELFITYGNIFRDLDTNLIFNIPISLWCSEANRLPFSISDRILLPDTPVYDQNHQLNETGRRSIEAILKARMSLALFEPGVMNRLIIASGGNLRDLFSLVNYAADSALLRDAASINAEDADGSIVNLRSDYERRLGTSAFDSEPVSYEEKAALLKRIYQGDKEAEIPGPVLFSLLKARAVQEFNGTRWLGVHPMVVDILQQQGHLNPEDSGVVPGGTRCNPTAVD